MESRQVKREQEKRQYYLPDEFYEKARIPSGKQDPEVHRKSPAFKIVLSLALVLVAIGIGTYIFLKDDTSQVRQVLGVTQESTEFTIYYPEYIPEGFVLNAEDIKKDGELVFLTISSHDAANKDTIVITQQAKPPMSFESLFSEKDERRPQSVLTTNGTLHIGGSDSENTATLVTNDSWVAISAPKDMPTKIFEDIVSGLRPIRS